MGLGNKKKKNSQKKKARWVNVGTVWQSDKFDGQYFSIPKKNIGCLLYHDKDADVFFKVKQMSVFNPSDEAPDGAVVNLSINLENEYHVEPFEEDGDEEK